MRLVILMLLVLSGCDYKASEPETAQQQSSRIVREREAAAREAYREAARQIKAR